MDSSTPARRRRRAPQRAVPQSVRRSGKPLLFGWGGHLTHHEREQVKERVALGIGLALALAVIGILGFGLYQDNVVKPAAERAKLNKPVAMVGSTPITYGWYHKVLHFDKYTLKQQISTLQTDLTNAQNGKTKKDKAQAAQIQSALSQLSTQLTDAGSDTLQQIIQSDIVDMRGKAFGLKIKGSAQKSYVDSVVQKQYGGFQNLPQDLKLFKLTQPELLSLIRAGYRVTQMQTVLGRHVPTTGIEANVRHILISTDSKVPPTHKVAQARKIAEKVYHKLLAGGSWKKLALKYSDDGTVTTTKGKTTVTGSKGKGGKLGWAMTSGYVAGFRKAANTDKIGAIEIVRSQFGFHVMEVLGRKLHAKLTKAEISSAKSQAFTKWLSKQEKRKNPDGTKFVRKYIHPSTPGGFTPPSSPPSGQ